MRDTHSISAGALAIEVSCDGLVRGVTSHGSTLLQHAEPLFELTIDDWNDLDLDNFALVADGQGTDGVSSLLSFTFAHKTRPIRVRASFFARGERIDYSLSLAIDWPDAPLEPFLHVPFLSAMRLPGAVFRYPSNPCPKPDGTTAAQLHPAFPMPLCFYDARGVGLSIAFDIPWPGISWDQNRNQELNHITDAGSWVSHKLRLRVAEHMTVVLEAGLVALSGGWPQAFALWRAENRRLMDLSQYSREDIRWALHSQFHHFTYVYGSEACQDDYTQVNVDKLIDAGEAFGGYDALLLWHQYPRLGLDNRSQWDFYDDFPGGLEGLGVLVKRAHSRGVKMFLPFKPWDAGLHETPAQAIGRMARLVIDCEIDGIFFDTMNSVPEGLRAMIDAERPGVVFCTEGRPNNTLCLEQITCSWDQYWNEYPMPESDMPRFLLPEHASPIIARWHMNTRKDMLISRAVFGGTGIVIWQDIFGAYLHYSAEQAARIARWKRLWHEHVRLFTGMDSIPLIDTSQAGLYANWFPGEDEAIITLTNGGKDHIRGALVDAMGFSVSIELWMGAPISVQGGVVCGDIAPGAVYVIHLARVPKEGMS